MITATPDSTVGNPFSTRHVRPGRLPFFDTAGSPIDVEQVLNRLGAIAGSAAIVGPHGSGKTTLLGHLADGLEARGRRVVRIKVGRARDGLRILGATFRARRGDIMCIDSWERLGTPWALVVRWCAAASRVWLLVTAHRAGAMPTLRQCTTTPAVLGAIVASLPASDATPRLIDETDLEQAFRAASGNVREALFLLYDTFEARARRERDPAA